jgi:DNA repair protein RadC
MPFSRLKFLPEEERPRERLLRDGVDALSHAELLAIVLGSGTRGKSVLDLSQEMLKCFGDLERLLEASVVELMQIRGIGEAKAIQLKAVFGLALKCRRVPFQRSSPIASAKEAFAIAQAKIAHILQEVVLVLVRDVRGCLVHSEQVSMGTLSQVLVHPREVFYPAVRYKAHSIIIAHNHPSGDPTPSRSDLELTRALIEASQVMSIGFDDHLIICRDRFVSLRETGCLPFVRSDRY